MKPRALSAFRFPLSAFLLLVLAHAFAGCATTPDRVAAPAAPVFAIEDTTEPTNGILEDVGDGLIVTASARARLNRFIALYGRAFTPALQPDEGVTPRTTTPPTYHVRNATVQRWLIMREWHDMGRAPIP